MTKTNLFSVYYRSITWFFEIKKNSLITTKSQSLSGLSSITSTARKKLPQSPQSQEQVLIWVYSKFSHLYLKQVFARITLSYKINRCFPIIFLLHANPSFSYRIGMINVPRKVLQKPTLKECSIPLYTPGWQNISFSGRQMFWVHYSNRM